MREGRKKIAREDVGQDARIEESSRQSRWLNWWYRLTAPPVSKQAVGLAPGEIARRGRLGSSMILLFCLTLLSMAIPVALISKNFFWIPLLSSILLLLIGAVFCNRRGKLVLTGVLLVICVMLEVGLGFVGSEGMLGVNNLPLFDLLVLSELIALTLLPTRMVFIVTATNIITFITAFILLPKTRALLDIVQSAGLQIYVQTVLLYLLVAVIAYLWIENMTPAFSRVERLQDVAQLEQRLIEQKQTLELYRRQLANTAQQFFETQQRFTAGDLSARVPFGQENMLGEVVNWVNSLLARLQRARQFEGEMQRVRAQLQRVQQLEYELYMTKSAVIRTVANIRDAKFSHRPLRAEHTGTVLDPLLAELSSNYIVQIPPYSDNIRSSDEQFPQI